MREAISLERGHIGTVFLSSGGNVGPWDGRCLCFVFFVFVCLSACSFFIVLFR